MIATWRFQAATLDGAVGPHEQGSFQVATAYAIGPAAMVSQLYGPGPGNCHPIALPSSDNVAPLLDPLPAARFAELTLKID